jgi:hypothetical protein
MKVPLSVCLQVWASTSATGDGGPPALFGTKQQPVAVPGKANRLAKVARKPGKRDSTCACVSFLPVVLGAAFAAPREDLLAVFRAEAAAFLTVFFATAPFFFLPVFFLVAIYCPQL